MRLRNVKPGWASGLDFTNPFSRWVRLAWYFTNGGSIKAGDISPTQAHGTLSGTGVSWVTSDYGWALSFDGTNASNVTAPSTPVPALPIAIHLRVKPTSTTPVGMFDSAPNQANVLRNFGTGSMEWFNASPAVGFTLSTTAWTDVLVLYYYDGNRQVRVYKNGVLSGSGTGSTSATYAWTTFAAGSINGGSNIGRYAGLIDHCVVFSGLQFTADMVAAFHDNPYQLIYQPRTGRYPIAPPAAARVPRHPAAVLGTGVTII